jgi:hypothetical protein
VHPPIVPDNNHTPGQALQHVQNHIQSEANHLLIVSQMNSRRESWKTKEAKGIKKIIDHIDMTIYRTLRDLNPTNVTSLEKLWKSINQLIRNPNEYEIDEVLKLYQNDKFDMDNQSIMEYYLNQADYFNSLNYYGRIISLSQRKNQFLNGLPNNYNFVRRTIKLDINITIDQIKNMLIAEK